MVAVCDVPDTVIMSLLVVKRRVREMFSSGYRVQHLHSGFGWKKEIMSLKHTKYEYHHKTNTKELENILKEGFRFKIPTFRI